MEMEKENMNLRIRKNVILPLVLGSMVLILQGCNNSTASTANTTTVTTSTAHCSDTNQIAFEACNADALETSLIGKAVCGNIEDEMDRADCLAENDATNTEELALCSDQLAARGEVCTQLGEARYDPVIDPANFVDPLEIGNTVMANTFFPLTPGLKWVYESEDETITVNVTSQTVEILGVTCIVVRDVVEENGVLIEDTADWYAQDLEGNVWYFGEIAQNFEDGELSDLDGSWKAGVDGAKAGILMKAVPEIGDIHRQEWLLAEAEDIAEVISLTASETAPAAGCAGTCLQTREFTPVEPGVSESKFYAPGIGPIVVFSDDEPDVREELVEFSTE